MLEKGWAGANKFYTECQGIIKFKVKYGGSPEVEKELLTGDLYKHMGSLTDVSGALIPEINSRMRPIKGASKSVKSRLVRNLQTPAKDRLSVVVIYLITKASFKHLHGGS